MIMIDLEQPMLSYYVIYFEKFKKIMQWTQKEALKRIVRWAFEHHQYGFGGKELLWEAVIKSSMQHKNSNFFTFAHTLHEKYLFVAFLNLQSVIWTSVILLGTARCVQIFDYSLPRERTQNRKNSKYWKTLIMLINYISSQKIERTQNIGKH